MSRKQKSSPRKWRKTSPSSSRSVVQKRRFSLSTSFQWLGGTGILLSLLTVAYQYLLGNISLEYLQPLSHGYEFQIKNDTPSDRVVKNFRVDPPSSQQVVYKITQNVYAKENDNGQVTLPGGNVSYVPAAEFNELDGQLLLANSTTKFRIPPLSSRPWMEPEATIVDIKYELEPKNIVLHGFEDLLNVVGLRSAGRSVRYLVIGNYWTISHSKSLDEALRVACRDDDSLYKLGVCNNAKH